MPHLEQVCEPPNNSLIMPYYATFSKYVGIHTYLHKKYLHPTGILSSYGELQHMSKGSSQFEALDPFIMQPKMSYKDGFQKR
jgi:hypothetical protein